MDVEIRPARLYYRSIVVFKSILATQSEVRLRVIQFSKPLRKRNMAMVIKSGMTEYKDSILKFCASVGRDWLGRYHLRNGN